MEVDAIVLPANSKLKEGSGTSQAIFQAAGRSKLKKACKRYGTVRVGNSVPTPAFSLPSKIILHTVMPSWSGGNHNEWQYLSAAYLSTLEMADQTSCESVAFPLLSSGNNGFDTNLAISIAIESIESFTPSHKLRDVYLVTYGSYATKLMRDRGYEVEELIDEVYVLNKDERYKPDVVLAAKAGAEGAQAFAAQAVEKAGELLKDPDVQKALLAIASQIAVKVIAGNPEASGNLAAAVAERVAGMIIKPPLDQK